MATVTAALPTPFGIQAAAGDTPVSYGGIDLRFLTGAIYNRAGRLGIADSLWLYQNPAGANWSVSVKPGMAVLSGTSGDGSYTPERYLITVPYASGTTMINLSLSTFNTAPIATRTHIVWLVVNDASQSGTAASYGASLMVTEDTGTGAPNPKISLGASFAAQLGTVTIAPGQSNITTAALNTTMKRASRATEVTAISYNSGYGTFVSGTIGQPLSYSIDGNTVRLQGTAYRTAGQMAAGTVYTIATLPPSLRPQYTRQSIILGGAPVACRALVNSNTGDLQVTPIGIAADYACFDGMTYELW